MRHLLVLDGLPAQGESVRDVATRLDVAHSTASRFVSRAERAGVVTRTTAPHDTRQTLVVPSPSGRELARRAEAFRLDRLAAIVDAWDEEDVRVLAEGLRRFAAASAPG
ncbi:MarR family winged helix-turn-helix transcriptional regulator [Isoptericola sp. NPDC057391]|uniref:MarR family winged helix-turn-helix transcriptional regulator n=1 Tax=Isoptericola sp. NPDC057391 TaxID=3346117 RepID=UPI00362CE8DB